MGVLYCIKNIVNGKVYVGISKCVSKRFNKHKNLLKSGKHFNCNLQSDYDEYGEKAFIYCKLEYCEYPYIETLEELYISKYMKLGKCYNIRVNNMTIADETKVRISIATKKAMNSDEVMSKLKRPLSEETKLKISNSLKETYRNNPSLAIKLSESKKGKKRKPLSEEEKTRFRGSNNGNSKVKEFDVIAIRERRNNGEQRKNVYADYSSVISERNFKAIWLYQNWKHIKV